MRWLIAAIIVVALNCWAIHAIGDDKHTVKHTELDPPRILHLTAPNGSRIDVVRESVAWFAPFAGFKAPGHVTTLMTLYGPVDVQETMDAVEAIWTEQ
jgi:hypothetical protein